MRPCPEYTYVPNQIDDSISLKSYDEESWLSCQSSAFPIKGFRSIDYLAPNPKLKEKIFSAKDQEGFKVQKERKSIFVWYFNLWYYVWYNIFRGIKAACTFVKDIF